MMDALFEWWRKLSEYLPNWARASGLAAIAIGEALRQFIGNTNLIGNLDLSRVNAWGWTLLGMAITFPVILIWRSVMRHVFGIRTSYDRAEEYINIIDLAMQKANLPKAQRNLQWNAVIRQLANDLKTGSDTPSIPDLALQSLSEAHSPDDGSRRIS